VFVVLLLAPKRFDVPVFAGFGAKGLFSVVEVAPNGLEAVLVVFEPKSPVPVEVFVAPKSPVAGFAWLLFDPKRPVPVCVVLVLPKPPNGLLAAGCAVAPNGVEVACG
jgi:hypothetical protein